MGTITSVSSNPLDAVQGTMWVIFNIDSAFTGSNINQITVTGDGRRSAVLHLNQALWLRVTNIPPSGTFTVTFATGALTPALDAEQSFKFTWANRNNAWTVTELQSTPDPPDTPDPPALPTLTIAAASSSMETGATQTITITSSAALTTFDTNDVTVSTGTKSGFTGSGSSYTFTLTAPASGSGTIHIDIPATSDWQAATRVSVTYAPPQPQQTPATVTLGRSAASIRSGQTATITATFNKAVTGMAANDFSANRGTLLGFTRASATVYRITWRAPSSGTGTATITLRANAATEQNAQATITVGYAPPAQPVTPPSGTLSIEAIDEQFITVGTEDYDLVIDIGGSPDDVFPSGHLEGFSHHWDAARGRLHIKSEEVTRLLEGVHWDVEAVKGSETLSREIAYNVVNAAPIFQILETIHLYRGVKINFDILIHNIPAVLIPDAYLIGLKSELVDYGLNVKGQIETTDNFTFTSGDIKIIVPAEQEGGTDTVQNYPFVIESGSAPQIATPKFTSHGDFGVLEFADVRHALGYEWQRDGAEEWNFFSEAQIGIDVRQLEVTPGHLSATLKFPNVANATSYAYKLSTESFDGLWQPFTGTLKNGMITTIISDLVEGEAYDSVF